MEQTSEVTSDAQLDTSCAATTAGTMLREGPMGDRQEDEATRAPLRYRTADTVLIVDGIGSGQSGEITAIHPADDRPYVVKVDAAYIRHTEASLTSMPVDGP